MKFEKHVKREIRELLDEQLKEYESNITMTKSERKELYDWVAGGRSPYDNGDYICGSNGYPLDFVSALRTARELKEWFETLSDVEKHAELYGGHMQYDTATDDICLNATLVNTLNWQDEDLPFQ